MRMLYSSMSKAMRVPAKLVHGVHSETTAISNEKSRSRVRQNAGFLHLHSNSYSCSTHSQYLEGRIVFQRSCPGHAFCSVQKSLPAIRVIAMRHASTINDLTKRNIELISKIEEASQSHRSTGERVADKVTSWIGSWPFLIGQSVLLAIWIVLNLIGWWRHWDPYPFILLNLALSFQAAYATPIIMMSQNRQAQVSERRNRLDLQINLLAEQENTEQLHLLRLICEKLEIPMTSITALEQKARPDMILEQIEKSAQAHQCAVQSDKNAKLKKTNGKNPAPKL
ncbi:hypothetical protein BH10PLA2_BH10PLA2_21090 [soil metagenome]